MFIGNYAKSVVKCTFCKGAGCSMCQGKGLLEKKHLLISEEPLDMEHIQRQQFVKTVKGEIVIDDNIRISERNDAED